MDFFLWGHMKALIYMLPVDSEEYLIVEAAATLWQQPSMFEHTRQSLQHYLLCIDVNDHTFENML
jgi:hypothetical protein